VRGWRKGRWEVEGTAMGDGGGDFIGGRWSGDCELLRERASEVEHGTRRGEAESVMLISEDEKVLDLIFHQDSTSQRDHVLHLHLQINKKAYMNKKVPNYNVGAWLYLIKICQVSVYLEM
jgi:hypothetical protein